MSKTRGTGLLMVWSDIDAEFEADFNRWYDEEHISRLLEVPGFLSAGRYIAIKGGPKYLAMYELEPSGDGGGRGAGRPPALRGGLGRRVLPNRSVDGGGSSGVDPTLDTADQAGATTDSGDSEPAPSPILTAGSNDPECVN